MKKHVYTIDYLFDIMKPYKIGTKDIKPIKFIHKDEKQLYSEEFKKQVMGSQFISIINSRPQIKILRESCVALDGKGGLITHLGNLYMCGQSGLYAFNENTIEVVSTWNKGYNMIQDIKNQIIDFDEKEMKEVMLFVNKLKLKKYTTDIEEKLGITKETKETINYKDKDKVIDYEKFSDKYSGAKGYSIFNH